MAKKWILTADIPDPITKETPSRALVHSEQDLKARQDAAKKAGVKTSVREVK